MAVRYSYDGFTTKGHGVIEYDDSARKSKRKSKSKSKFATRWPGPAPMKFKTSTSKAESEKSLDKQARDVFKRRFPGQQPKKGQIQKIKQELQRSTPGQRPKGKLNQKRSNATIANQEAKVNKIDELTISLFKKRFPGQQPQEHQLKEIKTEILTARSKLGV